MWYIIGLYLYPVFDFFGLIDPNIEGISFVEKNGQPGTLTAIHILLISIGMYVGYFLRNKYKAKGILEKLSKPLESIDPIKMGYIAIIFSFLIMTVFYYLVGFETSMANSAASRSGDFSGLEGNEQFLFLKTFSSVYVVATTVFPIALYQKKRIFTFLYLIIVVLTYLNSISRSIVFYGVLMPAVIFIKLRGFSFKAALVIFLLLPLSYITLLYGKNFGNWISAYIEGRDYEIAAYQSDSGVINTLLTSVSYQWYSVEAGIIHFFKSELPLFPQDVFLSVLFGIIPSRILELFGLDFLYYGNADVRLSCINTEIFGLYGFSFDCSVPTTLFGYAAYMLPLGGGFLTGFIMLRTFAIIEDMWVARERYDVTKIWIPYLWFIFFSALFSLVPNAIPIAELQLIWVFVIAKMLTIKFRR
jgi:hypothetical protein